MNSSVLINPNALRVGMYIQLEVGWMRHPFPVNSFRIASDSQLQTVKALGLEAIRYFPARSEIASFETPDAASKTVDTAAAKTAQAESADGDAPSAAAPSEAEGDAVAQPAFDSGQESREASARLWQRCDERFRAASREYMQLFTCAAAQPEQALAKSHGMVQGYLQDVLPTGDLAIRLLSESAGHRQAEHPVNVTVLCLLLGRALGMNAAELYELGLAALLHDIGEQPNPDATPVAREKYECHVGDSVALAIGMGVSTDVLTAMAQHHEFADGSGFPLHLIGEDLSTAGKVLCLVNAYDRLCNPELAQEGQTPHEALSMLYAQHRERFDPPILKAFIRMMGIYPPGTVVQLADGRFAMVVSVNSSRPLKPQVLVYDAHVPLAQAQPLDLEQFAEIGIRRSLRPDQLPRDALSYLSPRQRICYFFERAVEPGAPTAAQP